jgi:hypothetical protein
MKKLMRYFICGALAVIMLCSTATALAASSVNYETVVVTADLIQLYEQVFTGNGEVYDASGRDVTTSFVARLNGAYQSGDYESILAACYKEGISRIVGYQYTISQNREDVGTRAVENKTYSKMVAHLVTNPGPWYPGKAWYLIVTASGSYSVGYAYPNIIVVYNVSTPTVDVSYADEGSAFVGTLNSITISTPVISPSATSFSFSVTTVHSMTCPIPGMEWLTGTLGPFTNVSNFTV